MPAEPSDDGSLDKSLQLLARILFAGQAVEHTLDAVARLAQQTIRGCDSASLTVMHDGRPSTSVATSDLAWAVDQHQYDCGEGPCLDAVRLQTVVRVDSYAEERRWPKLTPAALERGARSSLSLPLAALDEPIGAMNLYCRTEAGFDTGEGVGQIFAAQAAIILANATALQRATELARHLSIALEHRDVIGQAKGILIAQSGVSPEEAFDLLRKSSQRSNRKLYEIAEELVRRQTPKGSAE